MTTSMDRLIVQTSFGPLYLAGRLHADRRAPVLFAMGGMWTPKDFLHELADQFPDASVIIAPLPGMGGSLTLNFKIADLSRAMDEVIGGLLRGLPVVAYGVSTGSLVTLGLSASEVVRQVALEPFFQTEPLWPFLETARSFLGAEPGKLNAALAAEEIFGLAGSKVTNRDYRPLLEGLRVPTDVILADSPLEPTRRVTAMPSLTSRDDRALLAAHPRVTIHPGPPGSGHDLGLTPDGALVVAEVLGKALVAAGEA
jgi:hypothetical protein